ncbi:MAG: hypothetical protein L6Q54_06305 [Leptospiraceae bacterium]|nr:hypothetical protein [Leptospiraceae bacterium]MCK6380848.1 hypothetical protein [Leptospiraceae bacterium]
MIALFKKKLTQEEMDNIDRRIEDPDNFPTEDEYIQFFKQKYGLTRKRALSFMQVIQGACVKAKYNIE